MTTPVFVVLELTSFRVRGTDPLPNRRLPVPSVTGSVSRRYSSIRSFWINVCARSRAAVDLHLVAEALLDLCNLLDHIADMK